jgi:hydroxymethylglutaryl-CoA synthase
MYLEARAGYGATTELEQWLQAAPEATFEDKDLETKLKAVSQSNFSSKVLPTCVVSKQIGNTYTASVYMNLANLLSSYGPSLLDKTITLFSYGSGALASMFEIIPRATGSRFTLEKIQRSLAVDQRLSARTCATPALLSQGSI